MSDSEQNKTEQASPYKLEQARKKGILAKSAEPGMVAGLACAAGYLHLRGEVVLTRLAALNARALSEAAALHGGGGALLRWTERFLDEALIAIAPLLGAVIAGALLATLAQTGVLFAPAAMKADFSRINPLQGLKRLLSLQTLIEASKACVKMTVYSAIFVLIVWQVARTFSHVPQAPQGLANAMGTVGLRMVAIFVLAAAAFAAIDQLLVRHLFARKMRMSRHEQKQEVKQREGDPRIKQRRKQLQRELLQRAQSLRHLRGADVLVTNPTHFAVALRYDPGQMAAPTVVSKGAGEFAVRLRRLALIYGVPVIESRGLARTLFRTTALEGEVSSALYRDTAAIYLKLRSSGARIVGA